jgi:hypothetical protein
MVSLAGLRSLYDRIVWLHIFRMDAVDGALMSYGSDMEALFTTAVSHTD